MKIQLGQKWNGSEKKKLKNDKSAGRDGVAGGMLKSEGELIGDWVWKLCGTSLESSVILWKVLSMYDMDGR